MFKVTSQQKHHPTSRGSDPCITMGAAQKNGIYTHWVYTSPPLIQHSYEKSHSFMANHLQFYSYVCYLFNEQRVSPIPTINGLLFFRGIILTGNHVFLTMFLTIYCNGFLQIFHHSTPKMPTSGSGMVVNYDCFSVISSFPKNSSNNFCGLLQNVTYIYTQSLEQIEYGRYTYTSYIHF